MLGLGLMPLGALAGGLVAHAAGLRAPYLVGGLLCLLSSLAALPLLLAANRTPPPLSGRRRVWGLRPTGPDRRGQGHTHPKE
jgi:MFS family permease